MAINERRNIAENLSMPIHKSGKLNYSHFSISNLTCRHPRLCGACWILGRDRSGRFSNKRGRRLVRAVD